MITDLDVGGAEGTYPHQFGGVSLQCDDPLLSGPIYVTNGSVSNPYGGLPGYWSCENSTASAGCAA